MAIILNTLMLLKTRLDITKNLSNMKSVGQHSNK